MPYAYHSNNTFLAVPHGATHQPFAIAGIPYDGAVTHRPGARFGPSAIRTASQMLCDGTHPYFDVSPLTICATWAICICPTPALKACAQHWHKKPPP